MNWKFAASGTKTGQKQGALPVTWSAPKHFKTEKEGLTQPCFPPALQPWPDQRNHSHRISPAGHTM